MRSVLGHAPRHVVTGARLISVSSVSFSLYLSKFLHSLTTIHIISILAEAYSEMYNNRDDEFNYISSRKNKRTVPRTEIRLPSKGNRLIHHFRKSSSHAKRIPRTRASRERTSIFENASRPNSDDRRTSLRWREKARGDNSKPTTKQSQSRQRLAAN